MTPERPSPHFLPAADVLTLIEDVRDVVAQKCGVRLETEVKIWRAGL